MDGQRGTMGDHGSPHLICGRGGDDRGVVPVPEVPAKELDGVYQPTVGSCPTVANQIAKASVPASPHSALPGPASTREGQSDTTAHQPEGASGLGNSAGSGGGMHRKGSTPGSGPRVEGLGDIEGQCGCRVRIL